MANVMMTVQPAMKTMTTMKPCKYGTDDNDGDDHGDDDYYDYDDTDNLC